MKSFTTGLTGAVLVSLSLALAGCASPDGESRASPSPSVTSSATPKGTPTMSPSEPPSDRPSFSPAPSQPSKPVGGTARLRGMIEEGVEAGCVMLTAEGVQYQLVGGDRTLLRPGRTVEVVGDVERDLATTCQQGVPLVVRQARLV